jgi:hypothetical protein
VDLSEGCLVVALAESIGVLEGAFMGKALDEEVDGLTELAKGPQGNTPYFRQGLEWPTDDCAS